MAQAKPQAIYIGLKEVGDAIQNLRQDDWDFLPHVPDIATLWAGLADETISSNIQIILILDQFFDRTGDDQSFEKLIASMSPHCFLGIINYQEQLRGVMQERITTEAYGAADGTSILYYFIDPGKPNHSLDAALSEYISSSQVEDVVAILTGRVSNEDRLQKIQDKKDAEPSYELEETDEVNPYLGQVVSVTSSKGGSGKSTVAVSLATYLAHSSINAVSEGVEEKPLKIIILDLDVRDGQIGFLTGNAKPTVINLRLDGVDKNTVKDTVIYSPRLKCDLLLAPKRPRNSDDTPPEFYVELIQTLKRMYDYIILDTSVNYLDPLLEKVAYPISDQIVFVTDIVVNSVFSMTRWIQEVTKDKERGGMGIPKKKIGIVVNKSLSGVNMPGEKIAQSALGLPIITVIPSNPKLIAHAANMQSMEVILKHGDLYSSIRRLARGIVGKKYRLSDNVSA